MTICITSLHKLYFWPLGLKLIDNLSQPIVYHPRKSSFPSVYSELHYCLFCLQEIVEIWTTCFNTFIDWTLALSYVSLTFARNWLILAVCDLVQLEAVYEFNLGLRLTDYLFTVFTEELAHYMVCVCVCAQMGLYMSESIYVMFVHDRSSEHFVSHSGLQMQRGRLWFTFTFFTYPATLIMTNSCQTVTALVRGSDFWHYSVNKSVIHTSANQRMMDKSSILETNLATATLKP